MKYHKLKLQIKIKNVIKSEITLNRIYVHLECHRKYCKEKSIKLGLNNSPSKFKQYHCVLLLLGSGGSECTQKEKNSPHNQLNIYYKKSTTQKWIIYSSIKEVIFILINVLCQLIK